MLHIKMIIIIVVVSVLVTIGTVIGILFATGILGGSDSTKTPTPSVTPSAASPTPTETPPIIPSPTNTPEPTIAILNQTISVPLTQLANNVQVQTLSQTLTNESLLSQSIVDETFYATSGISINDIILTGSNVTVDVKYSEYPHSTTLDYDPSLGVRCTTMSSFFDTISKRTFYVGRGSTDNKLGVAYSTDGPLCQTWSTPVDIYDGGANAIYFTTCGRVGNRMFAIAVYSGGSRFIAYYSENNGTSWIDATSDFPQNTELSGWPVFVPNPFNSQKASFICGNSSNGPLYWRQTTNGGVTWDADPTNGDIVASGAQATGFGGFCQLKYYSETFVVVAYTVNTTTITTRIQYNSEPWVNTSSPDVDVTGLTGTHSSWDFTLVNNIPHFIIDDKPGSGAQKLYLCVPTDNVMTAWNSPVELINYAPSGGVNTQTLQVSQVNGIFVIGVRALTSPEYKIYRNSELVGTSGWEAITGVTNPGTNAAMYQNVSPYGISILTNSNSTTPALRTTFLPCSVDISLSIQGEII